MPGSRKSSLQKNAIIFAASAHPLIALSTGERPFWFSSLADTSVITAMIRAVVCTNTVLALPPVSQ